MTTNLYEETSNSEKQMLSGEKGKESFKILRGLKSKHPESIFLVHLNVNSLQNKFDSLKVLFDIFLVSESKLESSFLDGQCFIPVCRIVRKDLNKNEGENIFLH